MLRARCILVPPGNQAFKPWSCKRDSEKAPPEKLSREVPEIESQVKHFFGMVHYASCSLHTLECLVNEPLGRVKIHHGQPPCKRQKTFNPPALVPQLPSKVYWPAPQEGALTRVWLGLCRAENIDQRSLWGRIAPKDT